MLNFHKNWKQWNIRRSQPKFSSECCTWSLYWIPNIKIMCRKVKVSCPARKCYIWQTDGQDQTKMLNFSREKIQNFLFVYFMAAWQLKKPEIIIVSNTCIYETCNNKKKGRKKTKHRISVYISKFIRVTLWSLKKPEFAKLRLTVGWGSENYDHKLISDVKIRNNNHMRKQNFLWCQKVGEGGLKIFKLRDSNYKTGTLYTRKRFLVSKNWQYSLQRLILKVIRKTRGFIRVGH